MLSLTDDVLRECVLGEKKFFLNFEGMFVVLKFVEGHRIRMHVTSCLKRVVNK